MLHGYCVRRAGQDSPSGISGLDGAPVKLVETMDLGLWYSESVTATPTPERLRNHELVVRRALREATPIPLRFGVVFQSEDEIRKTLGEKQREFLTILEKLADRVEMGLRISSNLPSATNTAEASVHAAPGSGKAYLEARRTMVAAASERRDAAARLLEEIAALIAIPMSASVREMQGEGEVVGMLAYLLPRKNAPEFRTIVSRLAAERPELRFSVSGPWAPYSFV